MKISVVIPVYNESESLGELLRSLGENVGSHELQVVLVDDGSTDGSFEEMCALQERFPAVEIIKFRRNLGKSSALAAGFARVEGDIVFTMDADLQDDPKEIPRFLEKIAEGHDVVVGWKKVRHDPWHKVFPSRVYNAIVSALCGVKLHDVNCGFKAFRRDVIGKLTVYGERHRLLPVMAQALGYKVTEIEVHHRARQFGASKYGWERFPRGAIDVVTVLFLQRYAHSPAHFFSMMAALQYILAVAALVGVATTLLTGGSATWVALFSINATVLFVGGCGAFSLGLIWEMLVHFFVPTDPDGYIEQERKP